MGNEMTMTTKMASVHQNHRVNLPSKWCQSRFKEVKPDENLDLSFDNLDVVDDAGNVIAYTVSRRTC